MAYPTPFGTLHVQANAAVPDSLLLHLEHALQRTLDDLDDSQCAYGPQSVCVRPLNAQALEVSWTGGPCRAAHVRLVEATIRSGMASLADVQLEWV